MLSIYQLKPAFQNLLRPGVKRLYDRGVTANQVTLFAAMVSVLLGILRGGAVEDEVERRVADRPRLKRNRHLCPDGGRLEQAPGQHRHRQGYK